MKTALMIVGTLAVLGGLVFAGNFAYEIFVEEPSEVAKLKEEAKKKPDLQERNFLARYDAQLKTSLSAVHYSDMQIKKGTCFTVNIAGTDVAQVEGWTSDGKATRMYVSTNAIVRPPGGNCAPSRETFSRVTR